MVNPVEYWHATQLVGIYAFQASQIEAILIGLGAPSVVRVNTTARAEVMLRHTGVEAIDRKEVGSFNDAESFERHPAHHCALAPAQRAIASVHVQYAVRQIQLKGYTTAVARCAMRGLDHGGAYLS
jgi:hypothetical protein